MSKLNRDRKNPYNNNGEFHYYVEGIKKIRQDNGRHIRIKANSPDEAIKLIKNICKALKNPDIMDLVTKYEGEV